jgi:hypothetical protein
MLVGLHASIENPTSTQTHLILATHNLFFDEYKKKKHKLFIAITLPIKSTSYNISFLSSQIFITTINFH